MAFCEMCKCPLILLKTTNGRREVRQKCSRCVDAAAAPKSSKVYRAPRPETARRTDTTALAAFMGRRQ